ncbi:MAG: phosphoenolpyruvate carboxykinase (ATP), partial [Planctomycetota bacterium]|nr:phosphoenolpyruvate carboxykinase (ATP) [Planctomycetota bacterium]
MTFLNAYFENPFKGAVYHNPSTAMLYEHAISIGDGQITSLGALATRSGKKTGRSPKDKRVVESESSKADIWWGEVNRPISPESFQEVRRQSLEFLEKSTRLYVIDGFAGWHPDYRIKVRIICERPYHALFMTNMLIRPTRKELQTYGEPDYVIYNAGRDHADPRISGVTTETCVALNLEDHEMVILGTQYAGEMKKGVFTIMNYLMPKQGVLSMHCSCNEGQDDVSLFFGLSGTGKTTLSADPNRRLIGDDEHCWTDQGVFNIEGGCYAKCIDLTPDKE